MRFFVKAIASGFAMSLGAAIFKKVSTKLGLDEDDIKKKTTKADKEVNASKAAVNDEDGSRS